MKKLTLFVAALFVSAMTVGAVAQTTTTTKTTEQTEQTAKTGKCKNCTKATTGKCCKDRLKAKVDTSKIKSAKKVALNDSIIKAKKNCCKKTN